MEENKLNVERLGKALSQILSNKYQANITVRFIKKEEKEKASESCN